MSIFCSFALVALFKRLTRVNRSRRSHFKSDLIILRVGVEEKTLNSFFSPCFSPFYAQTKEQFALVAILKRAMRAIRTKNE